MLSKTPGVRRLLYSFGGLLAAVFLVTIALLAWPIPEPPHAPPAQNSMALIGVTVIDPMTRSRLSNQTVHIVAGRIVDVFDSDHAKLSDATMKIDGKGRYLIPSLWDMHAHVGSELAPQLALPLFIANGVTNIRDMGGQAREESKSKWDRQARAGEIVGPRFIGRTGLFFGGSGRGLDAKRVVAQISDKNHAIKLYNRVLPSFYFKLMTAAREADVDVLGHRPRAVSAIEAANAGHLSFEHARLFLFECYPGAGELRERYRARYSGESNSGGRLDNTAALRRMVDEHDQGLFDELAAALVKNGSWFCPTHITRRMDALADDPDFRGDHRLRYIDRVLRADWNGDANAMIARDPSPAGRETYRDFYEFGLELTGRAHRAGVRILAGSDANDSFCIPGFGLHDELAELVKAGLTPLEAIRTATSNPAEYFGLENEYGSIRPGYVADLLLLDSDPAADIKATQNIAGLVHGTVFYSRSELDALLNEVEGNASSLSIAVRRWKEEL